MATTPDHVTTQTPRVRVDAESALARVADWHTRDRRRPLAAIATPGRRPTLFVADELLIDARDREPTRTAATAPARRSPHRSSPASSR
jgi:hypothetical protein